jgi:hypothetical protein
MNLRCKDGDIAVITWDYPDCLENIGRMVDVRGPVRINEAGPSWLIRPVSPEPYTLHESDHTVCREVVTWKSRVTHPDAWMMPVKPGQEGEQTKDATERPRPLTAVQELAQVA